EHREQPARPRADDQHVGFDRFAHMFPRRLDCGCTDMGDVAEMCSGAAASVRIAKFATVVFEFEVPRWARRIFLGTSNPPHYACRSRVRTTRPSSSAVTLISH